MKKRFLLIFLISSFLFFISTSIVSNEENSAEQYAQNLGIEKSAIKIISRLDRDNHFDELEKNFITWLASQDKKSQFKLAFKYAFDGEISTSEMSEILSAPITKNTKSEITSSPKSEIEYLMLDDFENKKVTEENRWSLGNNIYHTIDAKGKAYIDHKNGVETNGSSLCIEYNIPEFNLSSGGHGGEVGANFRIGNYKNEMIKYDGITFFVKTTDVKKIFGIKFDEEKNGVHEHFGKNYLADITRWKEVIIPFTGLVVHEVHAVDNILELKEIDRVGFFVTDIYKDSDRQGKIWIDKLALYKGGVVPTEKRYGYEKDDNYKQAAIYRGEDSQDLSFSIEDLPKSKKLAPHEALYYQKLSGNTVQCELCPNRCTLAEGEVGDCNNRKNIDGKLYTLIYGQPCALTVDPIEKGPMFHMKPGMRTLALGTAGCNLKCKNCQNWQFTQVGPEETVNYKLSPQGAIKLARKNNCEAIVFTYNDPIVSYEYVLEMAKLAKKNNLKTIMITAGYINPEPLRELCQYMDAIKIDLKGFTNEFYQKVCRATLQPVLDAIKVIKEEGVWLEIVNLVIPSFNDTSSEMWAMCNWIKDNVGPDVPLHFSRFWHSYKLENMETTPVRTLENAFSIATAAGLNYVYIGNVPGHPKGNTYCPHCGKLLIERIGFLAIGQNNIVNGKCKFCGEKIPGVW